MNTRKYLLVLALLTGLFSACAPDNCVTCGDCPNGTQLESEELCESDFNSTSDYRDAIELTESYGCTCE